MNIGNTPLLLIAVNPKTDADRDNLVRGIQRLTTEDPACSSSTDQQTGDVIIGGKDDLHLETIIDRLKREFSVEATIGQPHVAFKETFTKPATGEMKYSKQTEGRGQYAHVKMRLYPGEPGSGYVFENQAIGGSIPEKFIKPIDMGIKDALARGVLAGHPVDDVRVELYDGSYHEIDSTEMAFRIAGAMAFQEGARKAGAVLLEPVMRVEVVVPVEYAADVSRNLISRHGHVQANEDRGGPRVIRALVPLSQMFGYATDLRSRTRGRATFSQEYDSYQRVRIDPNITDDDRSSQVGAPLRPVLPRLEDSIALPEPDDGRADI